MPKPPRAVRQVTKAAAGAGSSWVCVLACGHVINTGPWRTSFGQMRPAPKTANCPECQNAR